MNTKYEKFLPVGSVVLLKEANKRIMIIGYCATINVENVETTYDYSGCYFPEGVLNSEESMLFNHEQIDKVFYYGLIDEEEKDFMERLKKAIEEEKNDNNVELPNINNDQIETFNIEE